MLWLPLRSLLYRQTMRLYSSKPFALPDLPYGYDALEPVISADIMRVHHGKHHQTYVSNLNAAMEQLGQTAAAQDVGKLADAVAFNAGGHWNHCVFWQSLCPPGKARGAPRGKLLELLDEQFGSFDKFREKMSEAAVGVQGSGWAWLGCNGEGGLAVATTKDQEMLLTKHRLHPLLAIDVWEHAYYLQYQNKRADFVKSIWSIINWDQVEHRLASIK